MTKEKIANLNFKMRIDLYTVRPQYVEFLRNNFDSRVPIISSGKSSRSFIGLVFDVDGKTYHYFTPLSSPKPKFEKMKQGQDFIKLDEGRIGIININNMIPVPEDQLIKLNYSVVNGPDDSINKYNCLLKKQMSWCIKNKIRISERVANLYTLITNNLANNNLRLRCCNFTELEKGMDLFISSSK